MKHKTINDLENSELFKGACDFIDAAIENKALFLISDRMIKQNHEKRPKWYRGCGFYEKQDNVYVLRYKTIYDVKLGDSVNGHEFILELCK